MLNKNPKEIQMNNCCHATSKAIHDFKKVAKKATAACELQWLGINQDILDINSGRLFYNDTR